MSRARRGATSRCTSIGSTSVRSLTIPRSLILTALTGPGMCSRSSRRGFSNSNVVSPFCRLRFLPGVFSRGNAESFFYYVTFLLPVVGLALVALLLWRERISRPEAAVVGMACVLCIIIVQTLVRGSPDSRLPDVASPISVVGAWVCATFLGFSVGAGRIARRTCAALRRRRRDGDAMERWYFRAGVDEPGEHSDSLGTSRRLATARRRRGTPQDATHR